MSDPNPTGIPRLQKELARVSQLRNRSYDLRIGEEYIALFANGLLVKDFSNLAEAILWLTSQTSTVKP